MMDPKWSFTLLLLSTNIVQNSAQHDCSLDVSGSTTGINMPVFVDNLGRDLIIPKRGLINLNIGQTIILSCPGSRNYLNNVHMQEVEASCYYNNNLKIGTIFISFKEITCKRPVRAEVKRVSTHCGHNGNLEIFYKTTFRDIPLIHVCYDDGLGKPVYTRHYLHGEDIEYAAKPTAQSTFSTTGIPSNVAISSSYKKAVQKSRLSSLLGSAVLATQYINNTSYLATGHLSPRADFVDTNSQRSTFFYINACHQWQAINNGNWKSVEFAVKRTAKAYNRKYEIITGTYDTLQLRDVHNNLVDIKLQGGKIPVPKYIWKVVYNPADQTGIALIVYNNPFSFPNNQIGVCQNICNSYGWSRPEWNIYSKGYVFCCRVNDLLNLVQNAPNILVRGVLRGVS